VKYVGRSQSWYIVACDVVISSAYTYEPLSKDIKHLLSLGLFLHSL
jgi:hypothetical protein